MVITDQKWNNIELNKYFVLDKFNQQNKKASKLDDR